MNKFIISSSYGWTSFPPSTFAARMDNASKDIKKLHKKLKFDSLAFTGSSGAALAFIISARLHIPIIYVRKVREKSNGNKIESNAHAEIKSYLIVDDFISSGATVRRIHREITDHAKEKSQRVPECQGVYIYDARMDDANEIEIRNKKYRVYTQWNN
jgi:adenine/guanine phosphoribosyltransferase-like PRPP-binding protein